MCHAKSENIVRVIQRKSKNLRDKWNVPKKVYYFGMLWEDEIYYPNAVKDGCP